MKSTKRNPILFSLLLALMAMTSCEKEDEQPASTPGTPTSFIFSDIQPNMEIMYQRYEQQCGWGSEFSFSGDTLILRTFQSAGQLFFEERFSPHSATLGMTEPVTYPVTVKESYILVPDRENSSLFYFFGNDTIWTNPTHNTELTQLDCVLIHENGEQFIGNQIGRLPEFQMGEISLENQMAVSCVPMILALSGYLIYDSQALHVSQAMNDSTFAMQGFALIGE